MIFTHEITLDITFNEIKIINIKQYTKDSFLLHVNLTDRGEPFCADKNNLICQFKMKTPDGKCIFTDGIINDDGSVDISIPEKACLAAGSGTAEIIFVTSEIVAKANSAYAGTSELLDSSATESSGDSIASYGTHSQDGAVFATMNLSVNIVASTYNNDSITSSDDFDALHSALLAANKTYDRVMTSANASADAAQQHEDNAATYAKAAADSAHAADNSANAASDFANAADTSANAASTSALLAQSYAVGGSGLAERKNENNDCAKHYCEEAGKESQKSSDSALLSKSYAIGGTGIERPDSSKTEAEDNAEYYCKRAEFYYQQAQDAKNSLDGALRPMGTVSFEELLTLTGVQTGDMYNISNQFTTNDQFREGPGLTIPLGANVYKTGNGKWDVLAGSPVTGVKGHSETSYRKGNVNITPANIGLGNVDNTADADKSVKYATSAGSATSATKATKATQDGDGNVIKDTYLPLTGGTVTGNLRLKSSGNYGNILNFGDGDYIHLSEPTDDHLEIKASYLNFVLPNTGTGRFTVNNEDIVCNKNNIVDLIYPVGSIYMSVNSTNPSTLFGGTWVSWGTGRVPVGVDTTQTEFNTVEKTGGTKTHTLTTSELPSHTHAIDSQTITTVSGGAHKHNIKYDNNATIGGARMHVNSSGGSNAFEVINESGSHTHSITIPASNTKSTGSGSAHNNLQPYITCYMWKRTA